MTLECDCPVILAMLSKKLLMIESRFLNKCHGQGGEMFFQTTANVIADSGLNTSCLLDF
jgi:hypothetical protein